MESISLKLSRSSLKPLLLGDEKTEMLHQAVIAEEEDTRRGETSFHVVHASIPQELIVEILSWLPVKSLLRFKCVSKQWCALIQDRHFIEKHMSRSDPHISCATLRLVHQWCGVVIHGCDGLSVETNSLNYWIRNRATRQRLDLPNPSKSRLSMTLSYIPSANEYKLVSISMEENFDDTFWEVLSVGKEDNSWRPLVPPFWRRSHPESQSSQVVSVGTVVHCIKIVEVYPRFFIEVVSLDLESEEFTKTVLPHEMFSGWRKVLGFDWNGFLSFSDTLQENLSFIVLEDYKKLKWSKEEIAAPPTFLKEISSDLEEIPVPLFARSGYLWILWPCRQMVCYDLETMEIKWKYSDLQWCNIFPSLYCSPCSLVTLDGMRSDDGRSGLCRMHAEAQVQYEPIQN